MPQWIDKAYEKYRADVASGVALELYGLDDVGTVRAWSVISAWGLRYQSRRNAFEMVRGAAPWLADALERRNRMRDADRPGLPGWSAELEPVTSGFNYSRFTRVEPLDPHPHGPSLRRVWLDAEDAAADFEGLLDRVLAWARAPAAPPVAPPPRALLTTEVSWSETHDLDRPWQAEVGGQRWELRLNDFPEDLPLTLIVDDAPRGDFGEWPRAWSRGPRPVPRAPVQVGAAAARWPDRYRAGEREAVWAELVAVGPDVRAKGHLAPAREVARETMRRARHDLDLLIPRLVAAGYAFGSAPRGAPDPMVALGDGAGGTRTASMAELLANIPGGAALRGLFEAVLTPPPPLPHVPRVPPDKAAMRAVHRVAKQRLILPLSLEAWIEEVGAVDLLGTHPVLCPAGRVLDPLVVSPWAASWADALGEAADRWREEREPVELPISPYPNDKADLAAGADPLLDGGIAFRVPEPAADGELDGTGGTCFVVWLRRALASGGFPGWEGEPDRPAELAALTEGFVGI